MDIWLNFGISTFFTILDQVIKKPEARATYKRVMLKIRDKINAAYLNDPDFASNDIFDSGKAS